MSGLNLICGLGPPDDLVDFVVVDVDADDDVVEKDAECGIGCNSDDD